MSSTIILMPKRHILGWHILLPLICMCPNLLMYSSTEGHPDIFKFLAIRNVLCIIFKNIYLFIYLPAPVLSCGTWDLRCRMWDLRCGGMRDLVPWPEIEPGPPALGAQSLNRWTTREVPGSPPWMSCPCPDSTEGYISEVWAVRKNE